MEQIIDALSGLILKAIPTIVVLVFLHFYLKFVLFGPLERALRERDKLTAGARKLAEQSLAAADQKTSEYEAKVAAAKANLYHEQEEQRRKWLDQQTSEIDQARQRTHTSVSEARTRLAGEIESARRDLGASSAVLADQIAESVLTRRPDGATA